MAGYDPKAKRAHSPAAADGPAPVDDLLGAPHPVPDTPDTPDTPDASDTPDAPVGATQVAITALQQAPHR